MIHTARVYSNAQSTSIGLKLYVRMFPLLMVLHDVFERLQRQLSKKSKATVMASRLKLYSSFSLIFVRRFIQVRVIWY